MDYQFRYRLQSAPEARMDGSGLVRHDIFVEASNDGENWMTIPRHKDILVPADELIALLETGTNAQKGIAYKQALVANLSTPAIPIEGWSDAQLEALMDANDASIAATTAAIEFITVDLGRTFPTWFNL